MSAEPLAWLIEHLSSGITGYTMDRDTADSYRDPRFTPDVANYRVTPLVAASAQAPPEGYGSLERAIACAAGHGHVFGPDPSEWPEFALREVEGWLKPAIARAVAAPLEAGRPTYAELADWIQRQGVCSEACLDEGRCVCGLDDLLSRLPREEP